MNTEDRLAEAEQVIDQRDERICELEQEIGRLHERIRELVMQNTYNPFEHYARKPVKFTSNKGIESFYSLQRRSINERSMGSQHNR